MVAQSAHIPAHASLMSDCCMTSILQLQLEPSLISAAGQLSSRPLKGPGAASKLLLLGSLGCSLVGTLALAILGGVHRFTSIRLIHTSVVKPLKRECHFLNVITIIGGRIAPSAWQDAHAYPCETMAASKLPSWEKAVDMAHHVAPSRGEPCLLIRRAVAAAAHHKSDAICKQCCPQI